MRRWWKRTVSGGIGLALVLMVATAAQAQPNSATIQVTANVLTPLTVTAGGNLVFGDVFPGVNKSVAITDAGAAGSWSVAGVTSSEVTLTFTLPASLASGGNTMPIVFGATDAGYNTTAAAGGATTFDPAGGATTDLSADATGVLYLWIGGTVQPAANQAAGGYSAGITLTVDYTGL
jgi:hypothetical protein